MNVPESQTRPGADLAAPDRMPTAPVERWVRPFVRFLRIESASGVVLLLCTAAALVLANSPWAGAVAAFWKTRLRVGVGLWELDESLLHWVNDGLMSSRPPSAGLRPILAGPYPSRNNFGLASVGLEWQPDERGGQAVMTVAAWIDGRRTNMIKSILIGLDGSPYSHAALELGIDWSRRFGALLVGLGIVDEPNIRRPEAVPIGAGPYKEHSDEVRLAGATRQVEQLLEQFALRCARAAVPSKVLEDVCDPSEQILREAQRYDLILLGRQTQFHFATREGPCETLTTVLKNAPRPVVAVPENVGGSAPVMVAFDGSLQAARALQVFQGTGLGNGQDVHVVTVATDHSEAARHAGRAEEFLGFHGLKGRVHVLISADAPATVLLDQARLLDVGLVVMGAYGRPAIREFFLGSVTRSLLKESPVPLFLYH